MDERQRLEAWPQETKKEPRDNLLHKGGSSGDMKEKRAPRESKIRAPGHDDFWVGLHD